LEVRKEQVGEELANTKIEKTKTEKCLEEHKQLLSNLKI
jgi:hypothetical protein